MKLSKTIWCNLYRSYKRLYSCLDCMYHNNCQYREYGSMRIIKTIDTECMKCAKDHTECVSC